MSFDKLGYEERLPQIYGYLFAVSTDSLSLPHTPGTSKLGGENGGQLFYDPALDESPIQQGYLQRCLFEQYLNTIAGMRDLAYDDTLLLYLLYKLHRDCTAEELAAFAGLAQARVLLGLTRLTLRGWAEHGQAGYRIASGELTESFEQAERDFAAVCFDGLSQEELDVLRAGTTRIRANILRRLSAMKT